MSTGNYLNCSIQSLFPDYYTLKINDILIAKDHYSDGEYLIYSLDNYTTSLGAHIVNIYATSLDGKNSTAQTEFWVFSASDIEITVIKLEDYEVNTTSNELIVNISCKYSIVYNIFIDTIIVCSGNYTEGQLITLPIDNYDIGQHNITIWARSLDGRENEVKATFTVIM